MGLRRVSSISFLFILCLTAAGCGSDSEFDPYESATTRAIREKVQAEMEIDRLRRFAPRTAHATAAAAASPTATLLGASNSTGGGASDNSAESAAANATGFGRGKALYTQNCSSCHGETGAGDGPVAGSLVPKPARHDDGKYMNALSNEHLFKVIKNGGTAVGKSPMMAPWGGVMSDDQIRDLIEFVRSLATPAYTGAATPAPNSHPKA